MPRVVEGGGDPEAVALEVTDHWDEEGKRFGSVGVPLDDSELADFDDDDPGAYAGRLLDELAARLPEHLRPVDTVRDALQAGLVEWVCDARRAAAEAGE